MARNGFAVTIDIDPVGYVGREWAAQRGRNLDPSKLTSKRAKERAQKVRDFLTFRDVFRYKLGSRRESIPKTAKPFVRTWIYYRGSGGPDPDHVHSAVLDCLLEDDRRAIGGVADYTHDVGERARVIVDVQWDEPDQSA